MDKPFIKRVLRSLGLIKSSDYLRYQLMKFRNRKVNSDFKKAHPNIAIPPDYLLYEAHQLKYRSYFDNGLSNAKRLKTQFEKYINLNHKKVLDWGCGPARIIRHFPDLLPQTEFFGTDYNKKTITWNKANIEQVSFFVNGIEPPTEFEDTMFDAIYGLSIFTHLSEENHVHWIQELYRISNKDAVLILTTHGEIFIEKLLPREQSVFKSNKFVIQGQTLEGHRTYAAYHPPKLMRTLFENYFQVLEHIPGRKEGGKFSQDIWILKK